MAHRVSGLRFLRVRRLPSRLRFAAALILLALPVFSAGTASAATQRVYFAPFDGVNAVPGFKIAGTGNLVALPGPAEPFGGSSAEGTVIAPDGKHLFINAEDGELYGYAISASGKLTPVLGSPLDHGDSDPYGLAITPDGKRLYTASDPGNPAGFAVANNGALTAILGAEFPPGAIPRGLAISRDGRYLYSADEAGIGAYRILADGTFDELPDSPYALGSGISPFAISIAPDGKSLYVPSRNVSGELYAFTIAGDGSLTAVDDSPYPLGGDNYFGSTISPDGQFLYLTDYQNGTVEVLGIRPDGGVLLTLGGVVPIDNGASTPSMTADGGRLIVSSTAGGSTAAVFIPGEFGIPDEIAASPFTTGVGGDFQTSAITPSQPPKAKLKAKRKGKKVKFNASKSKDPDGKVIEYAWNFGDGKKTVTMGPKVKHRYKKRGKYTAKVTTTDDLHCSAKYITAGQTPYCNGSKKAAIAKKKVKVKGKR